MRGFTYTERDFTFGQTMLTLRTTIGLTQAAVAEYLGVSRRAVGDWETGNTYPKVDNLKQLTALAVKYQAFEAGKERTEIQTLWQTARQIVRLDEHWLTELLNNTGTAQPDKKKAVPAPVPSQTEESVPEVDWGEAPRVPVFYGRQREMVELQRWVIEERYEVRVVGLLGLGGIGKSALAVNLMHEVAQEFEVVIWRSLRDAPNCNTLLDGCLQILAPHLLKEGVVSLEQRLSLLLEQLRARRVLLVLDNLETLLPEGTGHSQNGYQDYSRLLRRIAETAHQSCLLFTSREKPGNLVELEGSRTSFRVMRLAALDVEACEQLLAEKNIVGSPAELARLVEAYTGNPLALKIVGQTISDLFDGKTAPFLEQGQIIFGGVRDLLDEHFNRLSGVEQSVLLWLAIMREPATLDELLAILITPLPRLRLLEVMEVLHRRSLIECGEKPGSFTVQSVVLEYLTTQLASEISQEIRQGHLARFIEHGLVLGQAPEYVRQTQLHLLAAPILEYLAESYTEQATLEDQLLGLLRQLRSQAENDQGYGPANVVALLYLVRGHLRGLDLSGLMLRNVYLQGVEMQDTTLAGARLHKTVFTETFDAIIGVAVSANGEYWAASSRQGEIRIWIEGGQTLQSAWQAHAERVWSLAFSPDGHTLVSGGWDGLVKLWSAGSGTLLWSGTHTGNVNSVAFAPDGTRIASVGGCQIIIWDVESGKPVQIVTQPSLVTTVAWSPVGNLIATGDVEGHIGLWRLDKKGSLNCVQVIEAHTKLISEIAFAPDANILASASYDSTVKLWEVATGRLHRTLTGHKERVHRLSWSFDGRLLASGGYEKHIWVWDVRQDCYRGLLQGHTDSVVGLAFTSKGHSLLSSGDSTLKVWDVAAGRSRRVLQGNMVALFDVDWSPDGTQLVSGGSDKLVTISNVASDVPSRTLGRHGGLVFGVRWSPDGSKLASSSWDGTVGLWDVVSGRKLKVLRISDEVVTFFCGIGWSPDGQRLAGATYLNSVGVVVWDANSGTIAWQNLEYQTSIRRLAWSPDGIWLAGGDDNGELYLWDGNNGKVSWRQAVHHGSIRSLDWSLDGTRLASAGRSLKGAELIVSSTRSGELLQTINGHPGLVHTVVGRNGKRAYHRWQRW